MSDVYRSVQDRPFLNILSGTKVPTAPMPALPVGLSTRFQSQFWFRRDTCIFLILKGLNCHAGPLCSVKGTG